MLYKLTGAHFRNNNISEEMKTGVQLALEQKFSKSVLQQFKLQQLDFKGINTWEAENTAIDTQTLDRIWIH